MDLTEWAVSLMQTHANHLTRQRKASAEILIGDGQGWLAVYDLFNSGWRKGWLTDDESRLAQQFARDIMFSKFSVSVERQATALLSRKRGNATSPAGPGA